MPLTTIQSAMVGAINTASDNQAFTSDTPIYENLQTVSNTYVVTTGSNALSVGPISVLATANVTVPAGSVWTII